MKKHWKIILFCLLVFALSYATGAYTATSRVKLGENVYLDDAQVAANTLQSSSYMQSTAGFNALDPLTTKGDILTNNGTNSVRFGVGTDGYNLKANSNDTNGLAWYDTVPDAGIPTTRYQTAPQVSSIGTATISAGRIYFTPFYVKKPTTYTGMGFAPAVCTNCAYKVGIYASNGSCRPTGTVITNSTATVNTATYATSTHVSAAFGSNVTLQPGWYFMALNSDVGGTIVVVGTAASAGVCGVGDMATNGAQFYYTQAYANGMVDVTGVSFTANDGAAFLHLGAKVL